jgi:hypothetical protein
MAYAVQHGATFEQAAAGADAAVRDDAYYAANGFSGLLATVQATVTLQVVCSECKASMGSKPGFPSSLAGKVTHGVCPACLPGLRARQGSSKKGLAL